MSEHEHENENKNAKMPYIEIYDPAGNLQMRVDLACSFYILSVLPETNNVTIGSIKPDEKPKFHFGRN